MKKQDAMVPPTTRKSRQVATYVIYGLELLCLLLFAYSLRYIFQPTWAEKKLATLQSDLTAKQQNAATQANAVVPTETTASASSDTSSVVPTATLEPVATPTATTAPIANDDDLAESIKEFELALKTFFRPLPAEVEENPDYPRTQELINLGRMLYYDDRLSKDDSMSCSKCHDLQNYGVDGLARSLGVTGKPVDRNSPTVYNAALQISQFWDGRSPHVEDQATKPIMAAGEMGMIDANLVKSRLTSIEGYPPLFKAAFPNDADPINLTNVGIAIGAFERGLVTPSRFDKFLNGDSSQLSAEELNGLKTFVSLRCVTCHTGPNIGGTLYKELGVVEEYETEDLGRYLITKVESDKYVFKVPSLRNVAETAPYLHDGSIATLEEMVRLMARHQLGKRVTDQEVSDVVAFLKSLTGEIPSDYIVAPELP